MGNEKYECGLLAFVKEGLAAVVEAFAAVCCDRICCEEHCRCDDFGDIHVRKVVIVLFLWEKWCKVRT